MTKNLIIITASLLAVFTMQLFAWKYTKEMQPEWLDVPPPPSKIAASGGALGDTQLAYRVYGITMQNIGDRAGQVTALRELNYELLGKWFDILDYLDPKSTFMPMLVAYYFSATDQPEQLDFTIEYLRKVGLREAGEQKRWRWLVNAVFLAKHEQNDLDKALLLAHEVAALKYRGIDLPVWAQNLPSFIQLELGDKKAAYALTMGILTDGVEDMHPNEVNFMVDYLCTRILSPMEAATHELCSDKK